MRELYQRVLKIKGYIKGLPMCSSKINILEDLKLNGTPVRGFPCMILNQWKFRFIDEIYALFLTLYGDSFWGPFCVTLCLLCDIPGRFQENIYSLITWQQQSPVFFMRWFGFNPDFIQTKHDLCRNARLDSKSWKIMNYP